MHGRLGGTGQDGDPAGRPGLRARPGPLLRAEPGRLRPALPLPARDRRRAERLRRAARPARGRRRHLRRRDPDHPQAQLGQQLSTNKDQAVTGLGRRRAAARLLGDRLHDLSRLGRPVRDDGGDPRARRARPSRSASPSSCGPIRAAASSTRRARRRSTSAPTPPTWRPCSAPTSSRSSRRPTCCGSPRPRRPTRRPTIDISTLAERIKHVVQATFNGRRIVVFSGGEAKDLEGLFTEMPRHARRRRQRLDHRPQHLPAPARPRRSTCSTRSSASTRARCKSSSCFGLFLGVG